MSLVDVKSGTSPLILAMPHSGVYIPPEIEAQLNENGRKLTDTDWHVDLLYRELAGDATVIKANFHRYVIDPNRDPSGVSLYPGKNTTELVPETDFNGEPIWREPLTDEEKSRRITFHKTYHDMLQALIGRVRDKHGYTVLYDCHSIASTRPYLFDGRLPDFNIGDNEGLTCAAGISDMVLDICASSKNYTHVRNGRFKGGWTTRHYGDPENNIHAIQMELSQATYLEKESAPFQFDTDKASKLREILGTILVKLSEWTPKGRK